MADNALCNKTSLILTVSLHCHKVLHNCFAALQEIDIDIRTIERTDEIMFYWIKFSFSHKIVKQTKSFIGREAFRATGS